MTKRRYEGLFNSLKNPDHPRFPSGSPVTILMLTIEKSRYRTRPHWIIFWSEFKGEPAPVQKCLATDDDLLEIYQVFKNYVEREINNASEKTD
jgi:hypothetical protein